MNVTPQAMANAEPDEFSLSGTDLQAAFLAKLHKETRQAAMACFFMYREMVGMDSPLPILGWVTTWIRDWNLTEPDAVKILRSHCDPEKMMTIQSGTQLKLSLAKYAAECIRRAEALRKQMESRAGFKPPESNEAMGKAREVIAKVAGEFST